MYPAGSVNGVITQASDLSSLCFYGTSFPWVLSSFYIVSFYTLVTPKSIISHYDLSPKLQTHISNCLLHISPSLS